MVTVGSTWGVMARSTELIAFVWLSSLRTTRSDLPIDGKADRGERNSRVLLLQVVSFMAPAWRWICWQLRTLLTLIVVDKCSEERLGAEADLYRSWCISWLRSIDDRRGDFLKKRCNEADFERYRPFFLRCNRRLCKRLRTCRKIFVSFTGIGVGNATFNDALESTDERLEETVESWTSTPAADSQELM